MGLSLNTPRYMWNACVSCAPTQGLLAGLACQFHLKVRVRKPHQISLCAGGLGGLADAPDDADNLHGLLLNATAAAPAAQLHGQQGTPAAGPHARMLQMLRL